VVNAVGHATEYLKYDGAGRPVSVVDPNGVVTDLEYHVRGWLVARKLRGPDAGTETDDAITRIEYDPVGQVTKVTQPNGSFVTYTYDHAHRLTDIADNAGNTIHYTLDAAGNRKKEETKGPAGTVKRLLARQYDQLSRLKALVNAPYASQPNLDDPSVKKTVTTYDPNGNADTVTDPLANVADNDYDPLNRLIRTIQDVSGINATTQFAYDARDNLTQVTDPKGLITQYVYDGLNNLDQLISPDTGTTDYGYDAAGNRLTQTDARGVTSSYNYDALNRLTQVSYPNAALNTTFIYDFIPADCQSGETFGIGRLGRMTDASGETRYCHDRRGNVVRKVQVTHGETYVTRYSYDLADRLTGITYPMTGGPQVDYTRDALGRIVTVAINGTPFVTDVDYRPFGPIERIQFANGDAITRDYDQNYWTTGVTSPALAQGYRLDDVGNITGLGTAPGAPTLTEQYTYDDVYRLTGVLAPGGAVRESFAFDATGNRTSKTRLGVTEAYAYPPSSHRLASVAGVSRTYDANGNTTATGGSTYTYDQRNRLTLAVVGGVVTTSDYSGRGERVRRNETSFMYDESGRLLADHYLAITGYECPEPVCPPGHECTPPIDPPDPESMRSGPIAGEHSRVVLGASSLGPARSKSEAEVPYCGGYQVAVPVYESAPRWFVWIDDVPVAVIDQDGTHAVHADHLNTPRAVTSNTAPTQVQWRWGFESNPFGQRAANEDVDGNGIALGYPLRFPGQYLDAATGLHYNYFRDYEPETGRYVESDPIGLGGGQNTYAYVNSDPLLAADHFGLHGILFGKPPVWPRLDPLTQGVRQGLRDQYRYPRSPLEQAEQFARDSGYHRPPESTWRFETRQPWLPPETSGRGEFWRSFFDLLDQTLGGSAGQQICPIPIEDPQPNAPPMEEEEWCPFPYVGCVI
jgi:RHS repeat-associated protein